MAKKKKKPAGAVVQIDTTRAQEVLGHYHQIAGNLRKSSTRIQAEEALAEINGLPEATQVVLAKALSREQHTDAADLLVGINAMGLVKDARKEARRSLIHLEGQRIYPNWKPPVEERVDALSPVPLSLRRFWKGQVTSSPGSGMVDLMLAWEQGTGYRRVLALGFLLDFTNEGVKDFLTFEQRKDDFQLTLGHMAGVGGVSVKSCSLAEGRSLILRALEVNEQSGTKLPAEYRRNLSLVKQLILEAPGLEDVDVDEYLDIFDEDEDDLDEGPDLSGLNPVAVVTNFVEYWAGQDFDIAYRLLASDSPLREGLSEEEWEEKRFEWTENVDLYDLIPDFAQERQAPKSKLWLPRIKSSKGDENIKVIDAGWSIVLEELATDEELEEEFSVDADSDDVEYSEELEEDMASDEEPEETPPVEAPPELPTASAAYQETDRHWFWASYTLVKEQGEWRIQSITDEAALLRELSVEEVQTKLEASAREMTEYLSKHPAPRNKRVLAERAPEVIAEIIYRFMRVGYVMDALIEKHAELDLSLVQSLAEIMMLFESYERSLFYKEYIAKQSEELRIENLRSMAAARRMLALRYDENGDEERAKRLRTLAEQELHELLTMNEDARLHISLGDVLLEGEQPDEAEQHFLRATALTDDAADLAHAEMHLGEIAMEHQLPDEALAHFRRVTELQPDLADSWAGLGQVYADLDDLQEAETHFRHAIELEPANVSLYRMLSDIYDKVGDHEQALAILENGLAANPDSLDLNILMATLYLAQDDLPGFERTLNQIARLDPQFPALSMLRSTLSLIKSNPDLARKADKANLPPMVLPPLLEQPAKKKKRH